MTKNFHYSDKKFLTERKSFFHGVKKFFQSHEEVCKKEMALDWI